MPTIKKPINTASNAKVELYFNYKDTRERIPTEKIGYILMDYNYDQNVLPITYVEIAANDNLYKLIHDYKSTATFTLIIKAFQMNTISNLDKVILSDTFEYIPSTTSANIYQSLNEDSFEDNSYRKLILGLMSKKLLKKLKKSFNGIYKNVNQYTLISEALEGLNPVIEHLSSNKGYSSILIPPMTNRAQFLRYLFEKDPFFDSSMRFFIDFDHSYLLSKKGEAISAENGERQDVIINIPELTSNEAFEQGIRMTKDAYYLSINPARAKIIANEAKQDLVTNIITIDKDSNVTSLDLDYDDDVITAKQIFIKTQNPDMIKSELEMGNSIVSVTKEYIDQTIFSPNKCYNINNIDANRQFNGRYILSYKRVLITSNGGDFKLALELGLSKVGKLNKPNSNNYKSKVNKAIKNTTRKTSTSSIKNTAVLRSEVKDSKKY